MGRITRKKAAEVADALHIDEDAVLELENEDENAHFAKSAKELVLVPSDREPLGELESNSLESRSQSDDAAQELKKSTRGKKGSKRGGKGKKNILAASTAWQLEIPEVVVNQPEVVPDENDSTPSPASEKAAEELLKDIPAGDNSYIPVEDPRTTKPQTKAMKLTRSQLAKFESEPKSLVDGVGQTPEEHEAMKEEIVQSGGGEVHAMKTSAIPRDNHAQKEPMTHVAIDAPTSPLPGAVPTILARLRADTPAKRSTSNKENIQPPEDMASPQSADADLSEDAATTPASESIPHQLSPRTQDPITALDELDEAVDNVSKDIPDVQTSPEKPKVKRESRKAAPIVRGTKASQARISLAQNADASGKPSTFGQSRLSTTTGRANGFRQSVSAKPDPATRRVPSSSNSKATKAATDGEKKEVVIPHSKPRPVSLSFPTPPPPAKSTKAPTQSTFQLPGEAVAAKLKAAREARMQKEAEEEPKRTFKARPVPSSMSKTPSVRQTNASRARESIMNNKDSKAPGVPPNAAQKRVSSIASKPVNAPKPRIPTDTPKSTTISAKPVAGDLAVKKRTPTTLANTGKPRTTAASTSASPNTSVTRAPTNPTKGTIKGKEVFNRVAAAKAAADKEKLDKEAAAKKARADAAERGRQASRAWAEKQKKGAGTVKKAVPVEESKVAEEHKEETEAEQSPIPLEDASPVAVPEVETVEAS